MKTESQLKPFVMFKEISSLFVTIFAFKINKLWVLFKSTQLACTAQEMFSIFLTHSNLWQTLTYRLKGIFIDATQKLLCSEEVDIDVKVNYESGHCS